MCGTLSGYNYGPLFQGDYMPNFKLYLYLFTFVFSFVYSLNAQIPNDAVIQPIPTPPGNKPLKISTPTIDHFVPESKPVSVELLNDHHIFIDPKKSTKKSDVELFKMNYIVKIKPADKDGVLLLAHNEYSITLYFLQQTTEKEIRGVCMDVLPHDFIRKFYLFTKKPGDNYLAWTNMFCIQFKEISKTSNEKEIFEQWIKGNTDVYSIPIDNLSDTIYLMACIDQDFKNLEVTDIGKVNENLTVTVKSKLVDNAKFTFVIDKNTTQERMKTRNANNNSSSLTAWTLTPESINASKNFMKRGYRYWATKDYEIHIIGRLVEKKEEEVVIETLHGKKVTLKNDELIPSGQQD